MKKIQLRFMFVSLSCLYDLMLKNNIPHRAYEDMMKLKADIKSAIKGRILSDITREKSDSAKLKLENKVLSDKVKALSLSLDAWRQFNDEKNDFIDKIWNGKEGFNSLNRVRKEIDWHISKCEK